MVDATKSDPSTLTAVNIGSRRGRAAKGYGDPGGESDRLEGAVSLLALGCNRSNDLPSGMNHRTERDMAWEKKQL
jgi:hypothetical protein